MAPPTTFAWEVTASVRGPAGEMTRTFPIYTGERSPEVAKRRFKEFGREIEFDILDIQDVSLRSVR